ncbi:MAG: 50S ribosomal protein L25 [Sedimentisphaerales bacterium]|nr:50S ribosomal protein L25 [Sedimentisphaerales bacterium]
MVAKELVLKAELRKKLGSKHSAKVRQSGKIPAVVYGHGQEPEMLSLDEHDFVEGLHHGHRLFDVQFEGKTEKLLVKDIQYDHLGKKIIHTDLIRVDLTERVEVEAPLIFKGTPAGSHEGGLLEEHLDHLEIECTVTEIPEAIDVSVKHLGIGDSIHARDIKLPDGIKLITDPDALLISCRLPAVTAAAPAEEAAEEGEEPTSPEVITERKPKEGEEESEK